LLFFADFFADTYVEG